jgi:hypothetical protein
MSTPPCFDHRRIPPAGRPWHGVPGTLCVSHFKPVFIPSSPQPRPKARGTPWLGRLLCLTLLLAALLAGGRTQAVELKIEAPSFTFDSDRRIYRYTEARISLGDTSLEAQEVLINETTATLVARGQLRMRSGYLFISADRLELDVETQAGTISNARVYDAATGYYVSAETLNIVPGRVFSSRCSLTSCPPLVPGWKLSVRNLDYRVDDFATAQNALLQLGDVPVFWFPVLAWPTVQSRRSGLLAPLYSQRTASLERFDLGSRLVVPYFLDLGPDQDLSLQPDIIEKRGPALGAEYRYAFHTDQVGRLKVWGIAEGRARNPALENDILPPGTENQQPHYPLRYTLDYGHNEGVGDTGRLVLSAVRSSDGQVRREYDYVENYRPETTYQGTWSTQSRWGDMALTAEHASDFTSESLYANRDTYSNGPSRPQLLPRISYGQSVRPSQSLPVGMEFTSALTRFVTDTDVSGTALVARPALALPLRLGEALELRAQVGRQFVDYEGLYGKDLTTGVAVLPALNFAQSDGQVELRSTFAGTFDMSSGPYNAIKHRIVPRLIYDEVEDVRQPLADRLLRARIAERLLTFRLDNSFIGQTRRAPDSPEQQLQPTTEARSGRFSAFRVPLNQMVAPLAPPEYQRAPVEEFGQVNLIQRYNFLMEKDAPGIVGPPLPTTLETSRGDPLLPLIGQASYNRGGLGLSFETHYHHQLKRVTETAISMNASVRRFSRIAIGYSQNEFSYRTPENKLHPIGNALSAESEMEVADATTLGIKGRLDLRDQPPPLGRRLQYSEIFVDFHPLCYTVRLSVRDSLELTQNNGVDQYFTSRHVLLTFSLGNVFTATRDQVLTSGVQ